MAKQKKFDKVAAVKDNSRTMFRNMPSEKKIGDKRKKQPRFKKDWRDE